MSKIETIREALKFIPSDEYLIWRNILFALKSEKNDELFEIFNEWSQKSEKYNFNECKKVWNNFKDNYQENKITLGSLFYLAKKYGWNRNNYNFYDGGKND